MIAWLLLAATASVSPAASLAVASRACAGGESWNLSGLAPNDAQDEFLSFLAGKASPARSFSEALALARSAVTPEHQSFSRYWMARTLLAAGLTHRAADGFAWIAADAESAPAVRGAALQCLVELRHAFPSIPIDHARAARITSVDARGAGAALVELRLEILRDSVSARQPSRAVTASDPLSAGILASSRSQWQTAVERLGVFLASPESKGSLARYREEALLLLARAYFALGRHDEAAARYLQIPKSSNRLALALDELAWSRLMAGRYHEAIGTAVSLQAGGLRRTFTPESLMVMAMALNELCEYPDALRASSAFRAAYLPSYRWLARWNETGRKDDLYGYAMDYLGRQKKLTVPVKLASEWARSPAFQSMQDEIESTAGEEKRIGELGRGGSRELRAMAAGIRVLAADVKKRARADRSRLKTYKPGIESLSAPTLARLDELSERMRHFRRFRDAAGAWRRIADSGRAALAGVRADRRARIQAALASDTGRMLARLEDIAENNQLLEVEIYDGASRDLIWQNAHPDFRDIARVLAEEQRTRQAGDKVWDWGRTPMTSGDEDGSELWEDELGSFQANVADACSSKEKYLAIKRLPKPGRG